MVPVVTIVGLSNTGKTTILENIIGTLTGRGYRVAAVKHHPDEEDADMTGKDTWRLGRAGADPVFLVSREQVMCTRRARAKTLDELAGEVTGVDLIMAEGFKGERKPKIEVFRQSCGERLLSSPPELLAVFGDRPTHLPPVEYFDWSESHRLADFIERQFLQTIDILEV